MNSMLVIVPSFRRPKIACELAKIWAEFDTQADLLFVLDDDDPTTDDYPYTTNNVYVHAFPSAQFVAMTNNAVALVTTPEWRAEPYKYFGSMTDKHWPRTPGWEHDIMYALTDLAGNDLEQFGFAYPNDGLFGEEIPTACFMTRNVIDTLGWMTMPKLEHFACDNIWKHLGLATGRIRFLPDVLIEHMHSGAKKLPYDFTQQRSDAWRSRDLPIYKEYMRDQNGFFADVGKLNALK